MLAMTFVQESRPIQKRIDALKAQLAQLGSMRPGCLSLQYRNPKAKTGPRYQLSYTHQMKSRTDYVPTALVPQIELEIAEYKRFRELSAEWIALSIELSRLKVKNSYSTQSSH